MKKTNRVGKRTLLLGALILLLGLAVYLNWHLSTAPQEQPVADPVSGSMMGQAVFVNADASSEPTGASDYFDDTRTRRAAAREETIASFKEIVNNPKADASAVAEATQNAAAVAKNIETESNMESLIRAKGFQDCVVVIGEKAVTVVVKSDGLLPSDTVQIQAIAQETGGFSLEDVKIIEVK